MIDIGALIEAAGDQGSPVVFDPVGNPLPRPIPAAQGVAVVLVRPVTDAVKQVDDGLIRSSLDRKGLWWIEGFALDPSVLSAIGKLMISPEDLIQTVELAGFEWSVVESTVP